MFFERFVERMGEERPPRRAMFRQLFGGKGCSREQANVCMAYLEEYMTKFVIHFGM